MDQIYIARNFLISVYKKNAFWILPVLKVFLGFIIFNLINSLGYAGKMSNLLIILLMSALCSILPTTGVYFLIFSFICVQIFFASIELSVILLFIFVALLLLYIRVTPKKSLLIIGLILCYYYKIPFLIPLVAGLFLDITTLIPIYIGTFVWSFIPQIQRFIEITPHSNFNLLNTPDTFSVLYVSLVESVATNKNWITSAFIFTLVVITVNIISHLPFNYSRVIGLCVGALINLFGFMIAIIVTQLDINIIFIFVSTIVCFIIALLLNFFSVALDYERAENVEFEDEDNYYYVKVIPKIK